MSLLHFLACLQEAGTLIYRESENELQDMAVFYLPGQTGMNPSTNRRGFASSRNMLNFNRTRVCGTFT